MDSAIRLIGICSADWAELEHGDVMEFLRTADGQIDGIILVLRSCDTTRLPHERVAMLREKFAGGLKVVHAAACGVSVARNIGLRVGRESGFIQPDDYILFPDDDCTYPAGFGSAVRRILQVLQVDLLALPYAPGVGQVDRSRFPNGTHRLTDGIVLRSVASIGIVVRSRDIEAAGDFDPRLGAGTSCHSGEDTDLVLRLLDRRVAGVYIEAPYALHEYGHHDAAPRIVGRFAVLAKASRRRPRRSWRLLRGLPRLSKVAVHTRSLRPFSYALRGMSVGLDIDKPATPLNQEVRSRRS